MGTVSSANLFKKWYTVYYYRNQISIFCFKLYVLSYVDTYNIIALYTLALM